MEIELNHHKAFITKYTTEELTALKKVSKIQIFRREGKRKVYQETIHLLNQDEMSIPAPYFWQLAQKLDVLGFDIDLFDERSFPAPYINLKRPNFKNDLYEDQAEALEKCIEEPTGVIVKMTGGGKGRIIDELVYQKRVRTLIIVPTISIQDNIYYRLKEIYSGSKVSRKIKKQDWESLGSFKKKARTWKPRTVDINQDLIDAQEEDGDLSPEEQYLYEKGFQEVRGQIRKVRRASEVEKSKTSWPDVAVICFQSLDSLPMDYVESVEMIIIDEGDTAACVTIRENLLALKSAAYRYFLTATFWRNSTEETELLVAATGNKIIYEVIPKDTIESGQTMMPELMVLDAPEPKRKGKGEWLRDVKGFDNIVKRCIVANTERNKMIIDEVTGLYLDKRRIIIFIWEESHAQILKQRFDEGAVESVIYSSSLKKDERSRIEDIASHGTDPVVVIATSALRRGTDTVNIDTIILADVRKSPTNLFQSIGRGTRIGGNHSLLVVDIKDWFHETPLRWFLERQRAFKDYYKSDGSYTDKKFKKAKIKLDRV